MMKNSAKRIALLGLSLAVVLAGFTGIAQATVAYDFEGVTLYDFTDPSGGSAIGGSPGPDTGFLTITNNGLSSFSGTISLTGTANGGTDVSGSFTGTFGPGDSLTFASGDEGSNQGGFNCASGPPCDGLLFSMVGDVTDISGTEGVSLSILDKDIHSGVFNTSPCDSISTDAYVLQGGSPNGCDNGDGWEVDTQGVNHGLFSFIQTAPVDGAVPEPGTILLLGSGLAGLAVWRRRSMK